jgi:tripeptidyl-peptidase I
MFAPAAETVQAVREWLTSFGIHESRVVHSDNKGWLAFDATVEEAEKLLLTEYYEHEHRYSPNVRVGCDGYDILISVFKFS